MAAFQPGVRGRPPATAGHQMLLFSIPVLAGVAAAAFFVLRPEGRWSENDTAVLADAIAVMARGQRLIPSAGSVYPNGYVYQALSTFVLALTGLSVETVQQVLSPFLFAFILIPIAWVTYRELAGGAAAATLGALLLLVEPEFLFVTLRGSHEKVTRTLMLLALLLLARSFRLRHQPARFAVHVLLFHLVGYGIIASNNLFAAAFIAAIAVTVLGSLVLGRWWTTDALRRSSDLSRRLLYGLAALLAVAFIFTFYAYPPATHQIVIYGEIWQRVAVLLLNMGEEQPAGDPYALVAGAWVSLPVYFLVSLANWLLIAASLAFWLRDGWRWFRRRIGPPSQAAWLLWLLYGAFAAQGAAAVVIDFSGALGTNLQHRAFASFALVAVPVVARGVTPLLVSGAGGAWLRGAVSAAIGCLAVLSVLKATNEPLLSNKWMFYEPQEVQALHWADHHLRYNAIWTGFDERLTAAYSVTVRLNVPRAEFLGWGNRLTTRRPTGESDFVVSDITRLRAARFGSALPPTADQIRSYDNGTAQVYHRVPITVQQR
ncbi:MAG: hypothetical protein ACRDI2_02180 [Chloroflexota bacterium]